MFIYHLTSFLQSTILLIYILNGLPIRVEVLLQQYTPLLLSWPLATVNAAMPSKNLVSALFLLILLTLRRIYLEPGNKHAANRSIHYAIVSDCEYAGVNWVGCICARMVLRADFVRVYERNGACGLVDFVWDIYAAC